MVRLPRVLPLAIPPALAVRFAYHLSLKLIATWTIKSAALDLFVAAVVLKHKRLA
jgi:hypothetical protein